ncbi:MAG: DnaJ C-terminal domain-containing protein, partial [Candidatus Saccharimonadales bacterium]
GDGTKPEKPCNVCKGEGRVKGHEDIEIVIPAGIDNHQVLEIPGKGDAGKKGGKAGDLYARVFIKPHLVFRRKGDDLLMSQEITYSQAALGDDAEIPLLEGGAVFLKVPQGTESGKVLKISNKGVSHFTGYGRGALYVELVVKTPHKLSRKQKQLLEELKKEGL